MFPSALLLQPNVLVLLRTIAAPVWQMIKDDILEFRVFPEQGKAGWVISIILIINKSEVCYAALNIDPFVRPLQYICNFFSCVKELLLSRYVLEGIPGNYRQALQLCYI